MTTDPLTDGSILKLAEEFQGRYISFQGTLAKSPPCIDLENSTRDCVCRGCGHAGSSELYPNVQNSEARWLRLCSDKKGKQNRRTKDKVFLLRLFYKLMRKLRRLTLSKVPVTALCPDRWWTQLLVWGITDFQRNQLG